MAPNYTNLFMGSFEQNLLRDYFQKIGLLPLVWVPFIDDIFFIWTGNKDSLDHFISFTQNYMNMKSKVKFEIYLSANNVHFFDVTVSSKDGKLRITLFTKPADSQFYPSIVKTNFYLISDDIRLSNIFKQKPTVTYWKDKSLSDYILKNDIVN